MAIVFRIFCLLLLLFTCVYGAYLAAFHGNESYSGYAAIAVCIGYFVVGGLACILAFFTFYFVIKFFNWLFCIEDEI